MTSDRTNLLLESLSDGAEVLSHEPAEGPIDPELLLDAVEEIERLVALVADLEARNANLHTELARVRAMEASY